MAENLKGKKILFVCKESYAFPLYMIALEMQEFCKIGAFFVNPMESFLKKNPMNENTYYKFKMLSKVNLFDLNDSIHEFTSNLKSTPIDWNYLKDIEEKYTYYKTLNMQLTTAQMFSNNYHYRYYYAKSTYQQQLYWLQLNYRKVESILDEFSPEIIIDLDNSELQRSILAEVSKFKNIPYLILTNSRIENYKIASNSCEWHNSYFKKHYELYYSSNDHLIDEFNYLEKFKEKEKIISVEFKNQITSKFTRDPFIRVLKNIITKFIYIYKVDVESKNYFLRKKNPILFHSSYKYLKFCLFTEFKRWYLFGRNKYFAPPKEGEKYVLMPLHVVPESSTFVLAPYYIDELYCIKQVARSLPVGWMLYVKEHQVMVGERALSFYNEVNKIPNAKMVQFNYYKDPKPWINNSKGVITITGTGAFEAALLGKKSAVFGNVSFDLIKSVTKVSSFENLGEILAGFDDIDDLDIRSCAAYLKAVKQVGTSVPLNYLMMESEEIIKGIKEPDNEFQNSLESMIRFFDAAYKHFLEDSKS